VKIFAEGDTGLLESTQDVALNLSSATIGYTFSTAIALELMVPHSSLHQQIAQKTKETLVPYPKVTRALKYCSTEKEFEILENDTVGVALDDMAKGTKYGDIAFTMYKLTQPEKIYYFRAEVKFIGSKAKSDQKKGKFRSELLAECLKYFKKKDHHKVDYVVFISWIPFLKWVEGKSPHRDSTNKKALREYLEDPHYIVIDSVCSMKNTILNLPNIVVGPGKGGAEYLFSPDFKRAKQEPIDLSQPAYEQEESLDVTGEQEIVSWDESDDMDDE